MRNTLRGRLTFSISLIVIVILGFGIFFSNLLIERGEEKYVLEDIRGVSRLSKNYIYSSKILGGDKNPYSIINYISNGFSVYVALEVDGERIESGKSLNREEIEKLYNEDSKTQGKVNLKEVEGDFFATLYEPVFIEGEYYGRLILQKDYTKSHSINKAMLNGIVIILLLVGGAIVLTVFLVVKKRTSPLEELTESIKSFGEEEEREVLIDSRDEIGELSKEFSLMKEKIGELLKGRREIFINATHELKTPLTVINGYTQLLLEEEVTEDQREMLLKIENEEEKMMILIKRLLLLSKNKGVYKGEREEIPLKKTLQNIVRVYEGDKSLKLSLKGEETILFGVREDVEIILSNLIDNGVKYSSDGALSIEIKEGEITFENPTNNLKEEVKDNLFEPFIKGGENKNSTGLGLYIVKTLCENNGYSISYGFREKYITFTIKLTNKL